MDLHSLFKTKTKMKNLNLDEYGVQEMNQIELVSNDGGSFIKWFKQFVNDYFLPDLIQMV
jgi:hypothetical protein